MAKFILNGGLKFPFYEFMWMLIGGILVAGGIAFDRYCPLSKPPPQVQAATQPAPEAEPEISNEELAAKVDSILQAEAKNHADSHVEPQVEPEVKTQVEAEVKTQAEAEMESKPEAQVKPKPKADSKVEESKAPAKAQSTGSIQAAKTQPIKVPYYSLQVGVFLERAKAEAQVKALLGKGLPAFTVLRNINDRQLNYVYVGRMALKQAALEYKAQLQSEAGLQSVLFQFTR